MTHQGDAMKISYKLWKPIIRREDGEVWLANTLVFPSYEQAIECAKYEAALVQYVHDNVAY